MGIMLVYDITQEKSFENIKNWIRNIEENASSDVEKMLLGNKCELNDKRQVGFVFKIRLVFKMSTYQTQILCRFQENEANNWLLNMVSNL